MITREQIAKRVAEMAAEITRDFAGQSIVFVGVLKGASIFLGERLAPFHVAGIALILTGIWITSRLGRRPEPVPAGPDA